MNIYDSLNSFIGAGLTASIVGYIVNYSDPLIGAILWTFPFTILFPIFNLHKNKKSNLFISKFLKTQSYTLFLLVVYLYSASYFVRTAESSQGMIIPLAKGSLVWLIVSIIYFIIMKKIGLDREHFKNFKPKNLRIH